jgi:hypothetical protein
MVRPFKKSLKLTRNQKNCLKIRERERLKKDFMLKVRSKKLPRLKKTILLSKWKKPLLLSLILLLITRSIGRSNNKKVLIKKPAISFTLKD